MLKKLLFTLFLFIFIFFPTFIRFHIPLAFFLPSDKLWHQLKDKSFLTFKQKELILLSNQKKQSIPYENYLDFDYKGYYVFYDKMGNDIQLFNHEKQIGQWKNQFKYPRLSYPYLFNFSSDLSKVEVYHILEDCEKPIITIESHDIITSWHSSEKGEYFILGDLSGRAYVYSHAEKKLIHFQATKSRINYIKGVNVNSKGEFCVLGGLSPELLYISNYHHKNLSIYSIPATGRSNRLVYNFSRYLVLEKDYGIFIVDKKNKKIKEHNLNFKLYDAKEIDYMGENFLVVLLRDGLTTRVEIFSENNYQYSLWIDDPSIPLIEKRQKKVLILWENGAIEI